MIDVFSTIFNHSSPHSMIFGQCLDAPGRMPKRLRSLNQRPSRSVGKATGAGGLTKKNGGNSVVLKVVNGKMTHKNYSQ